MLGVDVVRGHHHTWWAGWWTCRGNSVSVGPRRRTVCPFRSKARRSFTKPPRGHASPGGSCLFAIFVVLERPGVDATRPSPRTSPGFPRRRCSPDLEHESERW